MMKKARQLFPIIIVTFIVIGALLNAVRPTVNAQEVEIRWGEWETTREPIEQWKLKDMEVQLANFSVGDGEAVEIKITQIPRRDTPDKCQKNEEAKITDGGNQIHRFADGTCDEIPREFSRIFLEGDHDIWSIWDGWWCTDEGPICNGSYSIEAKIRRGDIIQITPTSTPITPTTTPTVTPTGTVIITITPTSTITTTRVTETVTPTATREEEKVLKQGGLIINLDWQGEGVGPQEAGTAWCFAEGLKNRHGNDAHGQDIPHWDITQNDVDIARQWWEDPVPFWMYRDELEFYCRFEPADGGSWYDLVIGNYTRVDPITKRSYIGVGPIIMTVELLWPEIFEYVVRYPYPGMPDQLTRLAQDMGLMDIGWHPAMESKPVTGFDTAPETFTKPTPQPSSATLND